MSAPNMTRKTATHRLLPCMLLATALGLAAAPGITGPGFTLTAQAATISQPDGQAVYSWGYGCTTPPATGRFVPATTTAPFCTTMQVPGPTLVVTEGQTVTVTLTNALPGSAGNTSILFPGFNVTTSCPDSAAALAPKQGLLTCEAVPGGTVTYSFLASSPGTRSYYSGTQGDLQIEMGLYGTIIVLPSSAPTDHACPTHNPWEEPADPVTGVPTPTQSPEFRLSTTGAAYHIAASCYDREYLFQFSEIDPRIHQQAEQQAGRTCTSPAGCMQVETEPYHPAYFMINGRSMPDDMDGNYVSQYPHQPYNGNPHMHPGELVLVRVVGTGRWQHPFHEHGNHVRTLARDGNLIVSDVPGASNMLAGPLLFTTTTTPGLTYDGIFYWTGKGLNWDAFGHTDNADTVAAAPSAAAPCAPDANGYYTGTSNAVLQAPNYYEWCADHNRPLEAHPFGSVGSGGPITLPDPNIFALGPWFGGSPYLGPDAANRAVGPTPIPPSGTVANDPGSEAGFAFMWHSHNERELTTNNAFPGGMMMMMLVDPRAYHIDESK